MSDDKDRLREQFGELLAPTRFLSWLERWWGRAAHAGQMQEAVEEPLWMRTEEHCRG